MWCVYCIGTSKIDFLLPVSWAAQSCDYSTMWVHTQVLCNGNWFWDGSNMQFSSFYPDWFSLLKHCTITNHYCLFSRCAIIFLASDRALHLCISILICHRALVLFVKHIPFRISFNHCICTIELLQRTG